MGVEKGIGYIMFGFGIVTTSFGWSNETLIASVIGGFLIGAGGMVIGVAKENE